MIANVELTTFRYYFHDLKENAHSTRVIHNCPIHNSSKRLFLLSGSGLGVWDTGPLFLLAQNIFFEDKILTAQHKTQYIGTQKQLSIPMQSSGLHNDDVIAALRSGQTQAVEDLYARYRADFFRWGSRRFDANRHDLEDAWQDAVIAFYTQVMSGKLTSLRYEARVWLFSVGYKRLLNHRRKIKRILWQDEIDEALRHDTSWLDFQENHVHSEKKESLHTALKTMSGQCQEMLMQRYFMEKSIEEIQQEWEHNSANTTSATLSRCLKRLKDLIKTAQTATIK